MVRAARRPSSVCVGGIRTSTTATSGLWAPTFRIRSSASPAWPTTSKPDSSSRRTRPSRRRTESSATTTRVLIGRADYLREQLLYAIARKLRLRDEASSPRTAHERAEIRAVPARDEDHGGRVGIAGQP